VSREGLTEKQSLYIKFQILHQNVVFSDAFKSEPRMSGLIVNIKTFFLYKQVNKLNFKDNAKCGFYHKME